MTPGRYLIINNTFFGRNNALRFDLATNENNSVIDSPYHGTIKTGGINWWGKISYYRYHIEDPVYFNKKLIVTIEHGHDNHRRDDWSSTAYWYQREPHDPKLFPKLLDKKGRKPGVHLVHMIRKSLCLVFITFILTIWLLILNFYINV